MPLTPQLRTLIVNLCSFGDAPNLFTSLPSKIVDLYIDLFIHSDEGGIELLRLLRQAVSDRQVDSDSSIESWKYDLDIEEDISKTPTMLPSLQYVELLGWDSELNEDISSEFAMDLSE